MGQKQIEIFDSTLRDGAQGEGISFSVQDKINIVNALDELGVSYIEAWNPWSNPKDKEFFTEAKKLTLKNAKLVAFWSTKRKDNTCEQDTNLQSLLSAETDVVCIFGKTRDFQVTEIIHTTLEDNLQMIKETIEYLVSKGKEVIFDAEHFFTGYEENPEYTFQCINAAIEGGASTVCLCETKGGEMPIQCFEYTKKVVQTFWERVKIWIHTHNDTWLAVANSLLAVQGGAIQVQGVLLGFWERTWNANLSTIIANLQLKLGYSCIPEKNLRLLTPICKKIAEIANINIDSGMPYVGENAFAHKAGMHIDAVIKNPLSYEHIDPEIVGNERVFLVSEVAGKSMIVKQAQKFDPTITKESPIVAEIIKKIKGMEHEGYQFEGADGSLELLIRKTMGKYEPFFKLHYYKTSGESPRFLEEKSAFAQVKVEVEDMQIMSAGEGTWPVNALDIALHKALEKFYPIVSKIHLIDYKVRVLEGEKTTSSKVRVLIKSTDGENSWSTMGVSNDIIEASYLALVDAFEYKLIKNIEKRFSKIIG